MSVGAAYPDTELWEVKKHGQSSIKLPLKNIRRNMQKVVDNQFYSPLFDLSGCHEVYMGQGFLKKIFISSSLAFSEIRKADSLW